MFSRHQRAHSFEHSHKTLEWTLSLLYEVCNVEINMLRVENEALRFHYQQLNVQVQTVQQENEQKIEKNAKRQRFYNSKKQFWQLSKSARDENRQKIKKLVIQSAAALDEFKPVEVS